jgi:hypothetical protein
MLAINFGQFIQRLIILQPQISWYFFYQSMFHAIFYILYLPLVLVLFVWRTFVTLCVTVTNISMKSNDNMFISRLITYDSILPKDHPCHVCFKLADWFQKRRNLNNFPIGSYVKSMSADGGHFEPRSGEDLFMSGERYRLTWASSFLALLTSLL